MATMREKIKKQSNGLLMPLFGIYSKIENVPTVFYFTKNDTVLISAFCLRLRRFWLSI